MGPRGKQVDSGQVEKEIVFTGAGDFEGLILY
jgi:hypothetical protein